MELRDFGATGLRVSPIVFGAGAVGGAVFRGERDERLAIVRRALAAGINWIDTAPSYGAGQSEENLGWILTEVDETPHLSTKVRLGADELEDIPGAIEQSVWGSLERLQRDRVALLQLHNSIGHSRSEPLGRLSLEDVLGPGGVADALDAMCAAGHADFTGITALGEPDALRTVIESGRFASAQMYHNILNPSASLEVPDGFDALNYGRIALLAQHNGMATINIRVLAAGALGGGGVRSGGRALSPGSEGELDARRASAVASELAGEQGTLAQQAIRFALYAPGITTVAVGFSSVDQVDEAIEAAAMPPLSADARDRLERLTARNFGVAP